MVPGGKGRRSWTTTTPPPAPQPPVVLSPPCLSTTVVAIAFPLTQTMLQGCWSHPQASIVTEAHGAHLTLLSIFQRTFQKMVNTFGAFGPHWGPLDARDAQQRHIFSLQGHRPPNVAVWARIFMAWDHYGLGQFTHQGALGPRRRHAPKGHRPIRQRKTQLHQVWHVPLNPIRVI